MADPIADRSGRQNTVRAIRSISGSAPRTVGQQLAADAQWINEGTTGGVLTFGIGFLLNTPNLNAESFDNGG